MSTAGQGGDIPGAAPWLLGIAGDGVERELLAMVGRESGLPLLEAAGEPEAEAVLARSSPVAVIVAASAEGGRAVMVPRRVKAARPGVPVLVVLGGRDGGVGRRSDAVTAAALRAGADDVVELPAGAPEVVARLRATLRRLRHEELALALADDGPIVLGGLNIDVVRRRARWGQVPLALTDTEFDLLATLAGDVGRPFSRERLLNQLCRFDYEIDSRVIDVHVRNLRKKVEPDPSDPVLIRSVPGVGYCVAKPSD